MAEIKLNQSLVLFSHPWNLFNSQCFTKVQTPEACADVLLTVSVHAGVDITEVWIHLRGLLISYSSISLLSLPWLFARSRVLKNNKRASLFLRIILFFCSVICSFSKLRWHMHVASCLWECTDAEQRRTIGNRNEEQQPANSRMQSHSRMHNLKVQCSGEMIRVESWAE